MKKEMLKTGLTLMVFTVVAGLALSLVYVATKDRIKKSEISAKLEAINQVLRDPISGAIIVDEREVNEIVRREGVESRTLREYKEGTVLGPLYTFLSRDGRKVYVLSAQAPGYGGNVVTMACFIENGEGLMLNVIRVLDYSQETPGLGAKIGETTVQERFSLIPPEGLEHGVRVDKDAGSPQGTVEELKAKGIVKVSDVMTGATITPRAVTTAINLMYKYLTEEVLKR